MRIVDITVQRVISDIREPVEWSDEQRVIVNLWLERMAAEFLMQIMGHPGPTKMWIDADGKIQIEPVDAMEAQAGADPAAAAAGPEPRGGRADTAPLLPYWPLAYCGN